MKTAIVLLPLWLLGCALPQSKARPLIVEPPSGAPVADVESIYGAPVKTYSRGDIVKELTPCSIYSVATEQGNIGIYVYYDDDDVVTLSRIVGGAPRGISRPPSDTEKMNWTRIRNRHLQLVREALGMQLVHRVSARISAAFSANLDVNPIARFGSRVVVGTVTGEGCVIAGVRTDC